MIKRRSVCFKDLKTDSIFYNDSEDIKYVKKVRFTDVVPGNLVSYNAVSLLDGEFMNFRDLSVVKVDREVVSFKDIKTSQGFYHASDVNKNASDSDYGIEMYMKLEGYPGSSNAVSTVTAIPLTFSEDTPVVIEGLSTLHFESDDGVGRVNSPRYTSSMNV